MGNCKIIQVDDPIYKGLLQKHNGDNKAALDEYISSKALPLKASVVDITSTIIPHNSNVTEGFSVEEEAYATNIFTNYVAQTINAIQNTTKEKAASYKDQGLKDFFTKAANMNVGNLGDASKEGFDTVRNLAIDFYILQLRRIAKSVSPEQKAYNAKVIAELRKNNSILWSKVKNELKVQYGYVITEESDLLNENNELPTGWGDSQQFTINPNNRLSAEIKLHINSTPDVNPENYTVNKIGAKVHQQVVDNFGGIPKTLNFKQVVPHLMDYLPSATSVDDMMSKLMDIVDTKYPSLRSLHTRLLNDESLRNLFFSNFYQPAPMQVSSKVTDAEGVVKVDTKFHNKSGFSTYRLADTLVRNLKSNLQTGKYNDSFLSANLDRLNTISSQILGSDNRSLKIAKLNELFNELGIDTTVESIQYILDSKANRDSIKVSAMQMSKLQYRAKLKGLNLSDEELVSIDIDDRIIIENLITPFKYITDYVTRNAALLGTKTPVGEFDQYGVVLQLAEQLRLFHAPVSNNSVLNVHGEREYSNSNPSFIDDFFTLRNDKVAFTNRLRQHILEPSNHFNNWLIGENGLLNVPKSLHNGDGTFNITMDNVHLVTLNEDIYKLFDYKLFAGVSNDASNVGNTYSEISDSDWDLIQMEMFHTGGVESKSNSNQIGLFLPTPSDRNNTRVINALKYSLGTHNYVDGKILKGTELYRAIRSTVNQEIARMISATKLVERAMYDEAFANKLISGYHYTTDKYGKKVFKDSDGNYTGSTFKFYNTNYITRGGKIISLNDTLNINDILGVQNPYLNNQIKETIESHLDAFIDNTIANEITQYAKHTSFIKANITANTTAAIAEMAINYYLGNVEMVNMFMGSAAFYGNPGKANNAMNKRATQLLASGKGNVGFGSNKTFRSISITEAVLKNSVLVKDIYKQLKANGLSKDDATRISQMYASVDVADGQSYITLDEFENRLKLSGLDKRYSKLLASLKDPNAVLSINDMSNFVQLQKNFYYGFEYDETLGMNVPDQIKNSEFVLVPKFIKGTHLETLNTIMQRNKLAQVDMASARKVGHRNIVSLFNSETFAVEDTGADLDEIIEGSVVELKYQNLKRQQDIANHIKDTKNKLGTQIARAIITNINKPGLVKEYFNLLKHNIEEDGSRLLSDMGISSTGDNYSINHDKLISFIEQEVIDRDLNNNFVDGIKLNAEGNPNVPLDFNIQRRKYISILTSLFSNRVVDQKFPGVHGPQLSNLFMDKVSRDSFTGQTETSTFRKLEYQRYKDGKFKEAEVLMPAWSKDFFSKDGIVSIEDLQKTGLDTMIGYRIPTEDKHSMFVFKIVGFLDESQGSTIVVPFEFMAQTGADFDIDSIYSMRYNHYTSKTGVVKKHKYHTSFNRELYRAFLVKQDPNYVISTVTSLSKMLKEEKITEANNLFVEFNEKYDFKGDVAAAKKVINSEDIMDYVSQLNETRKNLLTVLSEENYNLFKDSKAYADTQGIRGIKRVEYYLNITQDLINEGSEDIEILNDLVSIHTEELRMYGIKKEAVDKYIAEYKNSQTNALANLKDEQASLFDSINDDALDYVAAFMGAIEYEEFKNLPVSTLPSYNGRKARENRILDLYKDILTSPETYEEMASSSSFNDTTNATDEANKASGDLSNITNYNTRLGQREYRKRVLSGRELKAQSVIRDGLNAISQIVGVRINSKVAPVIKYDLEKFPLKHLRKVFGKANVDDDGTVRHTYLANNATGTFKNVLGRLVTSYSAQSTAHILDNVKHPLPKGVNSYTFKVWKTFADLGGTWEFATKFINQPIIEAISEYYSASNSAYTKGSKQIFALAKSDYQKQLIKLVAANKDNTTSTIQARKLLKSANKSGNLFIPKSSMDVVYSEVFGYKVGEQTAFTEGQLETMLSHGNPDRYVGLTAEKQISYLKGQLRLLENFIIYDNIAKELGVLNNVTSFDKASVGPSFENATNRIAKIHSLHNDFRNGTSAIHVNNESVVTHIFPKYMRSIYDGNGEAISKDIESKYAVLEDYLLHGFVTPINTVGKEFINFSKGFRQLNSLFPNVHDDSFTDKLHTYAIAYGLRNLRFFNNESNLKHRVLGINYVAGETVDITTITDQNVELFKSKPLAIKLAIVKDQYADLIGETNILNSLNGVFDKDYVEKNGYYGVRYDVTLDDNIAIESFANLWYNSNPYLHLLAQDLVRYAFITKGFSFGNNNFSKIIPSQILYSKPIVLERAGGVNIIEGIDATREFEKFKLFNTDSLFSSYNYDTRFAINFSRANNRDRSIVPTERTTWTMGDTGEQKVDAKSINWFANQEGYIVLTDKQYKKLDYASKQAYVYNIQYHRGEPKGSKYGLFAHFAQYGENRDLDLHYFFPVTPLESNEFTNTSYNEANNIHPDPTMRKSLDEYLTMISQAELEVTEQEDVIGFAGEISNPLSSIETKILEKEGTIIVNRSSNIAEELNIYESDVRTFEANDTSYLISNLGYNEINGEGVSRWQYGISKLPAGDDTLKASVIDPADTTEAIDSNKKRITYIKDRIIAYGKREKVFKDNKLLTDTNTALAGINFESNEHYNQALALQLDYNYAYRTISALKRRIIGKKGFNTNSYFSDIDTNKEKQAEFVEFFSYASTFLKGFANINKLDSITKDDLTDSEVEINNAIAKLKSLGTDIDSLTSLVDSLRELYFDKVLTPLSTSPDIKNGIRNLFDVSSDESKVQLFMDSLADTNNPFVANLVKRYIVVMGRAKNDYTAKQKEFSTKLAAFIAQGYTIDSLLEKDSEGKSTNKFIREFNDDYKQIISDYYNKKEHALVTYGKYSKEYYAIDKEFDNWKLANLEHEDVYNVIEDRLRIQDILKSNLEANKALSTIRDRENEIRAQYNTSIDKGDISDTDLNELARLKHERKLLASEFDNNGIAKTGNELAIAKVIQEYNNAWREHIETYKESIIDPNFDKLLEIHKNSNTAESRKWLNNNTTTGLTTDFYKELGEAFETLGDNNRDGSKAASMNPYKDEDGIIDGNAVPAALAATIKANEEERLLEVDVNGNKATSILKPFVTKNNIVTTDAYKNIMEQKGESDNDAGRNEEIDRMNAILSKYATEENGIDYSAISLEDLAALKDIKDDLDVMSGYNVSDSDRADWQTWYKENHENSINEAAFRAMSDIAASKGDEYKKAWDEFNTSTVIDPKYFDMIAEINREIYGDKVGYGGDDAFMKDKVEVDSLRGDLLRKSLGNVEDFADLDEDQKRRVGKKVKSGLVPGGDHSLTSLLADGIVVITTTDGVPKTSTEVYGSIDVLQAAAKRMYEANKLTKRVKVKDRVAAISKLETTAKYDELLAKHGVNSKWYMDNHTLNHTGNIIPLPMWTNTLPSDPALYSKDAADKRFWGTSKVTTERYIDADKTKAKTWLNTNVKFGTTPYYDAAKLAHTGDQAWFDANHVLSPYTGKYEPISIWKQMSTGNKDYINDYKPDNIWTNIKTKPEYNNPDYREVFKYALPRKSSRFYNKQFDTLQNNPLYQYLKPLLTELVSHVQHDTIIDDGQLPISFQNNNKTINESAKGLLRSIGWYDNTTPTVVGENDEVIRFLKLPYLSTIIKDKLLPDVEQTEGVSDADFLKMKEDRKAENDIIRKRNDEYQQAHLNRDWEGIINNFIRASIEHKYKSEFEPELKLALDQVKQLKLSRKETSKGVLRDKNVNEFAPAGLREQDDDIATTPATGSNIDKHLEMFVKMVFYGEFEKNEGNVAKVARVIQNFTSAKGMWINIPGAFNNVAYGKTQIALERFGGYFFSNEDRLKAEKEYWMASVSMLAGTKDGDFSNKAAAMSNHFDVVELQDEKPITGNPELDSQLIKKLFSANTLYALHHMGEHYMQNAVLLSMLHSNKIVNGKAKSWGEHSFDIRHDAFRAAIGKDEQGKFDKFVADNKNKDVYRDGVSDLLRDYVLKSDTTVQASFLNHLETLMVSEKAKFDQNSSLFDSYELIEGSIKLKASANISEDELTLFRNKVIHVNQKIHGIYNKLDANTLQYYAMGRISMQFRKWMRPGWTKRFGSKFGKKFWNEQRNEYDQGSYVAFGKFITKPFIDNLNKDLRNTEEFEAGVAFNNILRDYAHFAKNVKLYWNTLDNSDKAGVKQVMTEIAYILGTIMLDGLLRGLGDDDNELKESKGYAYMLYLQDRLRSELLTYTPLWGWINESKKLMKSPFAAASTIEDMLSLTYTALFEGDSIYKGGLYSKEGKLKIKAYKMIPLVNRYLRYNNIESYAGYFKLYSY